MTLRNTWVSGDSIGASDMNDIANGIFALQQGSYGTLAGRPAAGSTGRVYYCTDCDAVYYDTGSAWVRIRIGQTVGPPLGDVPSTGWTPVNMQAGCSWAANLDGMLFTIAANGAGNNWMYQYRSYPGAAFTLTAYLDFTGPAPQGIPSAAGTAYGNLVISDGAKLIVYGPHAYNGGASAPFYEGPSVGVNLFRWSSVTAYASSYNTYPLPLRWLGAIPKWYQIIDNGTNLTWRHSFNGIDWVQQASESRTAYLTPSRIGIGASNYGGGTALLRVRSWNGVA